jgi:hypothetical protein
MASAADGDWVPVSKDGASRDVDSDACNFCRKPGAKLMCAQCKAVKYCDAQCQRGDWTGAGGRVRHKDKCRKPGSNGDISYEQAMSMLQTYVLGEKAMPVKDYIACLKSVANSPKAAFQRQSIATILRALSPKADNPLADLLCLDGAKTPWPQPLPDLPFAQHLEVRDSPLAGSGLFCTVDIPAGADITTYGMQAVKVACGYTPGMHFTQLRTAPQTIYLRTKYYTPDVDGNVSSHDLEADSGSGVISISSRYATATPENCRFLASMCNDGVGPEFLNGISSIDQFMGLGDAEFIKRMYVYASKSASVTNCTFRRHRNGVTTLVSLVAIPAGTELTVMYGQGNWVSKLSRGDATMDDFEGRFAILCSKKSPEARELRKVVQRLVNAEMRDPFTMLCMCPRCTSS